MDILKSVEAISEHAISTQKLRSDLEYVEADMLLAKNGFEVLFAVDFAEIFEYAHPFVQHVETALKVEGGLAVGDPRQFVRRQVALAFLFRAISFQRRVVMLPPYMVELRNHTCLLRKKIIRSLPSIGNIVLQKLRDAEHHGQAFDQVLAKLEQKEEISEDDKATLLEYISEYYKELLLVEFYDLENSVGRGLRAIRELVESNALSTVSRKWPKLRLPIDEIETNARLWTERLNEIEPKRPFQNERDAFAISETLKLNGLLRDSKKVILLLSHVDKMSKLEDLQLVLNVGPDSPITQLGLIRNPEYLVSLLVNYRSSDEETLKAVSRAKEYLIEYEEMLEDLVKLHEREYPETQINQHLRKAYPRAAKTIGEIERLQSSLTNVRLPLARERLLREYDKVIRPAMYASRYTKRARELALEVCGQDSLAKQLLETEFAGVIARILEERARLLSAVELLLAEDLESKISQMVSKNLPAEGFTQVTAPITSERLTYSIILGGEEIVRTLNPLLEAIDTKDADVIAGSLLQLFGSRFRAKEESDIHLLFAYLLTVIEAYVEAKAEIELGLAKKDLDSKLRHELLLLKSVILRISGASDPDVLLEAVHTCEEAVAIAEVDPRSLKELGLVKFRYIHQTEEREGEEKIAVPYMLDECILHTERAESELPDYSLGDKKELTTQILNNLAFFYLLKSTRDCENEKSLVLMAKEKLERLGSIITNRGAWKSVYTANEMWCELRMYQVGFGAGINYAETLRSLRSHISDMQNEEDARFYANILDDASSWSSDSCGTQAEHRV